MSQNFLLHKVGVLWGSGLMLNKEAGLRRPGVLDCQGCAGSSFLPCYQRMLLKLPPASFCPWCNISWGCTVLQSTSMILLFHQHLVLGLAYTCWLQPRNKIHCFRSTSQLPAAEIASGWACVEGQTVCSKERLLTAQPAGVFWLQGWWKAQASGLAHLWKMNIGEK